MTEKKLSKKEKVLICATVVGVVGAGVAGYFGIKYFKSNSKKQLKLFTRNKQAL